MAKDVTLNQDFSTLSLTKTFVVGGYRWRKLSIPSIYSLDADSVKYSLEGKIDPSWEPLS